MEYVLTMANLKLKPSLFTPCPKLVKLKTGRVVTNGYYPTPVFMTQYLKA